MKTMDIQGTGVAVVTPFDQKGEVDEPALKAILSHLETGQVSYLVMLGTTGESATLTLEEKKRILNLAKTETQGRIPLVVGIGGNNTHEIQQQIAALDLDGCSATLSVSPYYNKPTQAGLIAHYQTLADTSPLPIVLYNVPGRTGKNVEANTTLQLAQHPNIQGIKEASGDMQQVMDILEHKPTDFQVVSGDDHLTLAYLGVGMDGVISVTANAFPKAMSDMVKAGLKQDFTTARHRHYQLMPTMRKVFAEGNPGGVKAFLSAMGYCEQVLRLPLVPVSEKLKQEIKEQVSQ
jgi:4-hydroxy-tetrahydrodipicolinate synthase